MPFLRAVWWSVVAACAFASLAQFSGSRTPRPSTTERQPLSPDSNGPHECHEVAVQPGLELESHGVLNFGDLLEGSRARRVLRIRNTISTAAEIVEVTTPCGCTSLLTDLPRTVAPQAWIALEFQLDTSRILGPMRKEALVTAIEGGRKLLYPVQLTARSQPLFELEAAAMDLGETPADATARKSLKIWMHPDADTSHELHGFQVRFVPGPLEATLRPLADESGREGIELEVSVKPGELVAAFDQELVLQTQSTARPLLRIPVKARPWQSIVPQPSAIRLGVVRDRAARSHSIALQNRDGRPFRVADVRFRSDSTLCEIGLERQEQTDDGRVMLHLSLHFDASSNAFLNSQVEILCESPSGRATTVAIPVTAYLLSSK